MAQCTAPINGHRTASGRANCPVCGGNNNYYRSYSPSSFYHSSNSYSSSFSSRSTVGTGGNSSKVKAKWASSGSTILYTPAEIRTLTPVRENIEKRSQTPNLRDVFLCHAWDDRKGAANELYNLLIAKGVSVWFSEKDVPLGSTLLREIDKGLANSRIGIVLATPSFLTRTKGEGIADKELSALLARDLLVPVVHNTTFEALRDISPLLGSRSGLSTSEDSMSDISAKIAELISLA